MELRGYGVGATSSRRIGLARPRRAPKDWGRAADVVSALLALATIVNFAAPAGRTTATPKVGTTSARLAPPTRETVLGAYGGMPYTYPSDVYIRRDGVHDFTVKDVNWQGKPFTNPIYYGVRTTRWLDGGGLGAMLDFTHSKAIALRDVTHKLEGTLNGKPAPAEGTVEDHFGKLEASHGHNMLTLNGLLRLPSLGTGVSPYVGLGGGVSLPHMEVDIKGEPRTYEYQVAGPVGQALAGLELRFARVSVFVEYKFTLAPYDVPLSFKTSRTFLPLDLWGQLQNWLSGTAPPGGRLATTFISHQAIGGISIRFAPAAAAP